MPTEDRMTIDERSKYLRLLRHCYSVEVPDPAVQCEQFLEPHGQVELLVSTHIGHGCSELAAAPDTFQHRRSTKPYAPVVGVGGDRFHIAKSLTGSNHKPPNATKAPLGASTTIARSLRKCGPACVDTSRIWRGRWRRREATSGTHECGRQVGYKTGIGCKLCWWPPEAVRGTPEGRSVVPVLCCALPRKPVSLGFRDAVEPVRESPRSHQHNLEPSLRRARHPLCSRVQ